jgi:ABC-type bacteriocin/lantibiotic exporter with double-glycine peptidase domain
VVPEVIQMSAMDCGPATLKCLLEGFRIPTSYDGLREACRTDIDGTSINELERVARTRGLDVRQLGVPVDHVLLEEAGALPAIAVMRHPNGNAHFAVIWSIAGGMVQMMDPASGRLWRRRSDVSADLYRHTATVTAEAWRKWAGSHGFTRVLKRRIRDLNVSARRTEDLLAMALADPTWKSIATLDAATRSVKALADAAGVRQLRNPAMLLGEYLEAAELAEEIPDEFWIVRPHESDAASLNYQGAVLLHARGAKPIAAETRGAAAPPSGADEAPSRPLRALLGSLRDDGLFNPLILLTLFLLNACAVTVSALLLRSLVAIGTRLVDRLHLVGAVVALVALLLILFAERMASARAIYRAARRVEMYFRREVLRKVPLLGDSYFQTRLPADVAERSHSIAGVRQFPFVAARVMSCAFEIILLAAGIVWLDPPLWPFAIAAVVVSLAVPLIAQPLFAGHELRVRVHTSLLGLFYLDTLLGVSAIRAHAAERSMRREHQSLLVEWTRASLQMVRLGVSATALQMTASMAVAALLILNHLGRYEDAGAALLLVFWALSLPLLGTAFAEAIQRYQTRRSATTRIVELIHAPEKQIDGSQLEPGDAPKLARRGVRVDFDEVTVRLSGQTVLDQITLHIPPGEHVAVIGASGAGKSTLIGALLGWSPIAGGVVAIDGVALTSRGLAELRRATVWVDPGVQIWNRSLLENLRYGSDDEQPQPMGVVLRQADLLSLIRGLPSGLQTSMGEGGGLLSGGEGQRVRLARAMGRFQPRLALLDEPFRGLDRERRTELLRRSRDLWSTATLFCATHDVAETRDFDRVIVMDGGRIVEQGVPSDLASSGSRYAALLIAETDARRRWTSARTWRQVTVAKGSVIETI